MTAMVFLEKLSLCESVPEEDGTSGHRSKLPQSGWGKHNSGWGFWSLGIVPTAKNELVNCVPFAQTG